MTDADPSPVPSQEIDDPADPVAETAAGPPAIPQQRLPDHDTPPPANTEPATAEPASTALATTAPATAEPASTAPATTAEPASTAPATTAPATAEPATTAPATAEPANTAPATTAEPASTAPATAPPTTPRRRARRVLLIAAIVAVLAGSAGSALIAAKPDQGLLGAAPAAAATPTTPPSPYDLAVKALGDQATALLAHDHAGWMAAVDPQQPALRAHFEQLYAALQALHVSHFEYHSSLGGTRPDPVELNAVMAFCLSAATCPDYQAGDDYESPPHIAQKLFLKPLNGRYVISKLAKANYPSTFQPYPWEAQTLVYAQGKRVTVAAPKALAGKLKSVLTVADQAAPTDDRFAVLMRNPQLRYRVFLADDKAWKTWYGGENAKYAVAFTIPTGASGSDVVLHMSQLRTPDLKVILQHEMGHVATLSNLTTGEDSDMWLKEGVADYIGWLPQHTRQDWDFPAARSALRGGRPPKSIVEAPLKPSASDEAANRFYGLAHFAVECLVSRYGEGKAMNFVRLRLRSDDDLDTAARQAFGAPFGTVDKGCVSWMKQHS